MGVGGAGSGGGSFDATADATGAGALADGAGVGSATADVDALGVGFDAAPTGPERSGPGLHATNPKDVRSSERRRREGMRSRRRHVAGDEVASRRCRELTLTPADSTSACGGAWFCQPGRRSSSGSRHEVHYERFVVYVGSTRVVRRGVGNGLSIKTCPVLKGVWQRAPWLMKDCRACELGVAWPVTRMSCMRCHNHSDASRNRSAFALEHSSLLGGHHEPYRQNSSFVARTWIHCIRRSWLFRRSRRTRGNRKNPARSRHRHGQHHDDVHPSRTR